ncbi:MAG TPA: hypothetical protein EYP89_04295 [Candidatus Omnitrophica bacterium]|nr:hypothetical protein [Candidatus Omnitrophota bacterium]
MCRWLIFCLLTVGLSLSVYPQEKKVFYIYADKNSPQNHFIPSGWMGDYGDLKFNERSLTKKGFSKVLLTCSRFVEWYWHH